MKIAMLVRADDPSFSNAFYLAMGVSSTAGSHSKWHSPTHFPYAQVQDAPAREAQL